MGEAWLDSLSEDWVSQPASPTTAAPPAPAATPAAAPAATKKAGPTAKASTPTKFASPRPSAEQTGPGSRIPRLCHSAKKAKPVVHDYSSILGERSTNELFASASPRRTPSKLSKEIKPHDRPRYVSRSMSDISTNSVVHNTVNHKDSVSASPARRQRDTPEWKRRLVYGHLSYGEQRDLFTSKGAVLENIFKPPPPTASAPAPAHAPDPPSHSPNDGSVNDAGGDQSVLQHEATLPSSPPQHANDPPTVEIHVDESMQELPPLDQPARRAPTSMQYRRNDESADITRDSDLSLQPVDGDAQQETTAEQTGLSATNRGGPETESRKVSGQSVVRNEDFSPILLEKRQASDGKTAYAPADLPLPPDELRDRLEKLRLNQKLLAADLDSSAVDEPVEVEAEAEAAEAEAEDKLPKPDATAEYEELGGFVNFRRGGRSRDGSFRHHMLSSALNDTSELHPEESLQASTPKQFPTFRMEHWAETEEFQFPTESLDLPRVPAPSPAKRDARAKASSGGSPLKLFQPYDTFTNQTLLRRISQFQEEPTGQPPSMAHSREEESGPGFGSSRANLRDMRQSSIPLNQFGLGELDGYEFSDEFSFQDNGLSRLDADKENWGPDESSIQLPRAPIFEVRHDSSPPDAFEMQVRRSRQKSINSASSRRTARAEAIETRGRLQSSFPSGATVLATPQRGDMASEFKRPRTSPSKDPTPKRRRTLHRSDVGYEAEDQPQAIGGVQLSHQHMQSILARDADRPGSREMPRPRTPTPTSRSSAQLERLPLAEIEQSPTRSSRHSQSSGPRPVGTALESDRKPSIKTEDFINEANKIMAFIRSKAGLASGLASLEESEQENGQPSPDLESSYESTQEPFSRPPSREGRAPVTHMSARQADPEIVERLKQYEEASEMGDIMGSSIRSATLAHETWDSLEGDITQPPPMDDDEIISDPPNIRLSRNPDRKDHQSFDGGYDGVLSRASSGSASHSTGRSFPTGSSRGSDTRKTIAPESVEHLIPDQVGSMVLDRQRNIWIRRKSAGHGKRRSTFLPSEASEDDPFADIPDLSVDMTMEMRNLIAARQQQQQQEQQEHEHEQELREREGSVSPLTAPKPSDRDRGRDPLQVAPIGNAPVGSKTSKDTHAHALGNPSAQTAATFVTTDEDVVEHEIGIHDGRANARRRNLTISFSSPIASIIQDPAAESGTSPKKPSPLSQHSDSLAARDASDWDRRAVSVQTVTKNGSSRSRSHSLGPSRYLSVRGQAFVPRPISRIDEREEESVVDRIRNQRPAINMELSVIADNSCFSNETDGEQQRSVSFLVKTPARPRDCAVAEIDATPVISQYVGTYSLSSLPEFTVHQGEESLPLEASYIVDNHHLVTGDHTRRVMSMNTRDLVDKLAEVEPFGPYWDDMRDLDLRNKRLGSLHALDEFCGQLESLDVSNNEIRNLSGIPSSVRQLKLTNNQLSSLTAWSHLMNLQYVDVSNNGLTSLAPFKNLVHLRSLRADNNQLTSIDGIKFHNTIQTLRARGNAIEELDFGGNRLDRLTELDLKNNAIKTVANIEELPALSSLNLEGNRLETFAISSNIRLDSLRHLRLDDNNLTTLSISHLPLLRLLHADRNCLTQITGFSRARRIDSLSLREQRGSEPLDLPRLLSRAYEVRKLYLSGNLFESFSPTVDFLNLQLLELANCGLQALPDHVGQMMPNLRVLNLSLNAISDLAPLRYVPRLKRLLASGNRLADCAGLVDTLANFAHLAVVDVRDNPVTQGFYPPVQTVIVKVPLLEADPAVSPDPFALPDQDPERDASYCSRLDLQTRMRRRLYEKMVREQCRRLKRLDGLALRRDGAEVRDGVWEALVEGGFVVAREGEGGVDVDVDVDVNVDGDGKGKGKAVEQSPRWPAEDSFGG
ncbi:hypothetical protein B0T22DRAFT_384657 [Podospora appendiculata]|uniref:Septation initiation network scaffold protein cdc11 n=1 Tax=Podospora appendiculata TaxID=314037 RepID=A0AAE0X3Q4_9PEZI|nr:hypothetical protein B0T22DRAFT_384657 [Podospora appendiculata]